MVIVPQNPQNKSHDIKQSMNNEYLDYFIRNDGNMDNFDLRLESSYKMHLIRDEGIAKYSFAVPSNEAIEKLVKLSPVVEVGAGLGYWASLVEKAGGDILAYDLKVNEQGHVKHYMTGKFVEPFCSVQQGDAESVVELYSDRTLFLCWPPYDRDMAYLCLKKYVECGGKTLVYVGEDEGGCTANDAFFKLLYSLNPVEENIPIPSWFMVHDYMTVYSL